MKVEFTDYAKADLHDLRRHLRKYKPAGTWDEVRQQIQRLIHHLAKFPDSGSVPDELTDYADGFRQSLSSQQRIIYKVAGDKIYVHLICGQAQDLQEVLQRRLTKP